MHAHAARAQRLAAQERAPATCSLCRSRPQASRQHAASTGRRRAVRAAVLGSQDEITSTSISTATLTGGAGATHRVDKIGRTGDLSLDLARACAKVADDTKAEDLILLHVEPVVSWTSYVLLVTVNNRPQMQAVLFKIEKMAKEVFDRTTMGSNKGRAGGWELMDFGSVVVNVLTPEERERLDLETFYGGAEELDLEFVRE